MPISNPIEHFSHEIGLPTTLPPSLDRKDITSIKSDGVQAQVNQKLKGSFAEQGGVLALQRTGDGTFRIDLHWEISDSTTTSNKTETLEITLKDPSSNHKEQFLSALLVAKTYRQAVIQAHKSPSRDIDFKVDFLRATLLSGTNAAPTGDELIKTKVLSRGQLRHAEHQAAKAYNQFKSQTALKNRELPPPTPPESRIKDSQLDNAKALLQEAKGKLAGLKQEMATTKQSVWVDIPMTVENPRNIERLERLLEATVENPTPTLLDEIKVCRKEVEKEMQVIEEFLSGKKAESIKPTTEPTKPADPKAALVADAEALLKEANLAMKKFLAVQKMQADPDSPHCEFDSAKRITNGVNQPNLLQMEKSIAKAKNDDTLWDDPFKLLKDRYNPQAKDLIDFVQSDTFQAIYQSLSAEEKRQIEA